MTELLPNYFGGQWSLGTGAGSTLVDPVLGTPLVRVDATGLDLAAGFAFARCRGVELIEAGAGPKLALKAFVLRFDALQAKDFAKNRRPAGYRYQQQNQHHKLHDQAGVQHKLEDVEVLVHGVKGGEVDDKASRY